MSGGPTAIKGFQAQTLVALLESLELDNKLGPGDQWTAVTIEPDLKGKTKKIDFLWEYEGGRRRAVQVKSTSGTFTETKVRVWAEELLKWDSDDVEYEVCLVGSVTPNFNKCDRAQPLSNTLSNSGSPAAGSERSQFP